MTAPSHLPTISLVTPVFNQARYIEATIRSVLDQHYPHLEYIIIDGGSTDGTQEIIRRYEDQLAYWISEPDGGMYEALNKGFDRSSGEIMGWLNADDMHFPWTLHTIGALFGGLDEINWITSHVPALWDHHGNHAGTRYLPGFHKTSFLRGEYLPGERWRSYGQCIQQESTFWRRSLWNRAGARLDTSYKLAGDFELWARFFNHGDLYGVEAPLAGFRVHPEQLTATQSSDYNQEALRALRQHKGQVPPPLTDALRRRVDHYLAPVMYDFGRLMGLYFIGQTCFFDHAAGHWQTRRQPIPAPHK